MTVVSRTGFNVEQAETVTIKAGETGLNKGCVVYLTDGGHHEVALAVSDTIFPFGVLMETLAAGDKGAAAVRGEVAGRAGATYDDGVELTINGAGEFIAAGSGDRVMGIAIEAASAADELFAVRFIQAGPIKA